MRKASAVARLRRFRAAWHAAARTGRRDAGMKWKVVRTSTLKV